MFADKVISPTDRKLQQPVVQHKSSGGITLPAVQLYANGIKELNKNGDAQAAKSLPAVKPFQETTAKQSNSEPGIVQGVFFEQPPSRDVVREGEEVEGNALLGAKCYAYSLFNALAQAGRTPEIDGEPMTKEQVDEWITEHERDTDGGSPQGPSKKMEGGVNFMKIEKNHRVAVQTGLDHNFPVSIGVSKPSNHWIYATGTTGDEILAEDQQNPQRGVLHLKLVGGAWTGSGQGEDKTIYTISQVMIGYEDREQYRILRAFY
jgi:hypothetical protein